VHYGIDGTWLERRVRFDSLRIGGFLLERPLIGVPLTPGSRSPEAADPAGYLGTSVLRHFVVYLDYARQRVILEKGDDFERSFGYDRSGLMVGVADNGLLKVMAVVENSPAAKAGFLPGDIIRGIDGRRLNPREDIVALRQLLSRRAGIRYEIETIREGRPDTLEITLRELLR